MPCGKILTNIMFANWFQGKIMNKQTFKVKLQRFSTIQLSSGIKTIGLGKQKFVNTSVIPK